MKPPANRTPSLTILEKPVSGDDDTHARPLEWGLIRRLFGYTRPLAAKRNWLIFLTLSRAVQLPMLAWAVGVIIAGPVARADHRALLWSVAGYALLALVTEGMFHFRQRFAQELGETVVNRLRNEVFACVQRQPMGFFHRTKLGRIIGRMTSDIEALRAGIQDVFFVSIVQAGQMVAAAAMMAWTDRVMFLVVLAMAPILWAINRYFRVRLSHYSRATQESFSRITANLAESVNGIRVTQGFVREDVNAGLFRSLIADHARYNISLARTSAVLVPILELNTQFFISALLMLGGWRTFGGHMEVGDLITFFFLANLFFQPIQVLANQYNHALISMAGAERVFRLIDLKPDWTDAPDAAPLPDPRTAEGTASSAGLHVEFRDVGFAYVKDTPVLRGVSFEARPGQTVALVGHTGSGKSSILNLVTKFYLPDSGAVLLDGHDVHAVTGRSLHRQMGMVTQQNFLFTGTVLANIRLAKPDATEDDVRAAARALDCLDLLEALPNGLHTEVGERGGGLSLGQRQIVCFTRAMLADPRLVILDEATSSIDALTEARLQTALARLLKGRTSLVVAHRLSTIRHADLVLVLDQGEVVERGTHDELLALRGHYAELHAQFTQSSA
ncbi:MAG: ABC transporter ATP-binding protein [Verrucomicrobiota bacterium]